jgi:RNA polymerase sigma-70 factor (ECF subfamily)
MKARNRRRDAPLEQADQDPRGQVENTDTRVLQRELNELLEAALDQLAPEYRAAVVMREVDGRAYEEIALLLNCSIGTVKSRLFRARTQLRGLLADVYGEVVRPGSGCTTGQGL